MLQDKETLFQSVYCPESEVKGMKRHGYRIPWFIGEGTVNTVGKICKDAPFP